MKNVGTGKRARKRRGMLAFEWILLISLLVIGVIGGLSTVRNALLCELQDVADCIQALNCGPCSCEPCDPGCGASCCGWWCCGDCGGNTNP
jgi:hypothetical protein